MDSFLGIGARIIKKLLSTPNLRNFVPFLHLLVAFDNYLLYAVQNWISNRNVEVPEVGENQYRGISAVEVELRRNWIFTSATPTFRFSK